MEEGEHCEDMPDTMTIFTFFFPQFISLGCRHLLQSAAKGLRAATAGNSSRLSSSCGCWCPLLPRDWCCTPVLCPQVAVWIMLRNKHCHMERAFVWSSLPFGQHRLPSKCRCGLLLIMLAPCEIWSRIQCLSVNLQDPQRAWQSWPRQCLPRGSDVLEQLLSPETIRMSLLRPMVEAKGEKGHCGFGNVPAPRWEGWKGWDLAVHVRVPTPWLTDAATMGKDLMETEETETVAQRIQEKKRREFRSFWKINIPCSQFGRWVSTFYVTSLYFGIYKSFSEVLKVQDRYNDLRHSEFNIRSTLWKSSVLF